MRHIECLPVSSLEEFLRLGRALEKTYLPGTWCQSPGTTGTTEAGAGLQMRRSCDRRFPTPQRLEDIETRL